MPADVPHPSPTGPLLPPGTIPPSYVVEGSNELLQKVQRMLGIMGADQRRDTPEFKHLMEQYKRLGGELHAIRKLIAASTPAHKPQGAAYTRPLGQRPGNGQVLGTRPLMPPAGVRGPGPASPSVRAPSAVPTPPAPPADAPTDASSSRPQIPVPPALPPATTSPAQPVQPAAPAALPHPAPGATPMPIPPFAEGAPVQPLTLPKFQATLGPASQPNTIHSGPEVRHLQELLTHLGYKVQPTGTFDIQTAVAVKAFQQARGLKVNGVVGAEMRRVLNEMVSG